MKLAKAKDLDWFYCSGLTVDGNFATVWVQPHSGIGTRCSSAIRRVVGADPLIR